MAAPYSLMARSKESSAKGRYSAAARTNGNDAPNSRWNSPAISSWLGVGSNANGVQPRPESHAET